MFRHRVGPLVSRTLAGPGKALWLYLVAVIWSFQYVEGELIALSVMGKSASQSTTYHYDDFRAYKAVDGNTQTYFRSRQSDPHPWWGVELKSTDSVRSITATLRADCCGDSFIGAVARAGLSATITDNQQCGLPATVEQSKSGAVITFYCDPSVTAKYVSVNIENGQGVDLHIAEVTVKDEASSDVPLLGNLTSQSTTRGDDLRAYSAIDGRTDTWSETTYHPDPWWRLDLGDEHCIGRVNVTPRVKCCGDRFIGVTVRAGVNLNHIENQQCGSPATKAQSVRGVTVGFMCDPPVKAKYVSLDISNQGALNIAEVTVEEFNADGCLPEVDNSVLSALPTTAEVTVKEQSPTQAVTDAPGVTAEATSGEEQSYPKVVDYPEFKSGYYNRLYKGSYIGNPDPLSTEVAWNLRRCAAHCVVHDLCYIFDYAPRTGKCHLYKLLDQVIPKPDNDFYIYELAKCLSELSICKIKN